MRATTTTTTMLTMTWCVHSRAASEANSQAARRTKLPATRFRVTNHPTATVTVVASTVRTREIACWTRDDETIEMTLLEGTHRVVLVENCK